MQKGGDRTSIVSRMTGVDVGALLQVAWTYRDRGLVLRQTAVGAAALADDGTTYGGCNVQQRFHSHDIHAEVNAISTLIAEGRRDLVAIAVVAERDDMGPCGSCLDWILEIGGDECLVVWQCGRDGAVITKHARDLMPFHPSYSSLPAK